METMQSLLFTGDVRSGSRATMGDLDQLEQKTEVSSFLEERRCFFLPQKNFSFIKRLALRPALELSVFGRSLFLYQACT